MNLEIFHDSVYNDFKVDFWILRPKSSISREVEFEGIHDPFSNSFKVDQISYPFSWVTSCSGSGSCFGTAACVTVNSIIVILPWNLTFGPRLCNDFDPVVRAIAVIGDHVVFVFYCLNVDYNRLSCLTCTMWSFGRCFLILEQWNIITRTCFNMSIFICDM